jgi:hypothetical protein
MLSGSTLRRVPAKDSRRASKAGATLSPATLMGPPCGVFCHEHGTTRLPVMGPPGVSYRVA